MAATGRQVAFLEGKVGEHSDMLNSIREAIVSLEHRVDRRFELIEHRLTTIEHKADQRFFWLVGMQVTTLVAIVAAMAAMLSR